MGTDDEWEKWGKQDPYFGVLTDERYRNSNLDSDSRAAFFESGEQHVTALSEKFSQFAGEEFKPDSVLDFGCGTGRLAVAFAKKFEHVTGVDVAPSMIKEAEANRDTSKLENLNFKVCKGDFSDAEQKYSLVNTYIVLQHIPKRKGMTAIRNLLRSVNDDGFLSLHLTFGNQMSFTQTKTLSAGFETAKKIKRKLESDPEMIMTYYDLNDVMRLLLESGFADSVCELTDQAGSYGINILAKKRRCPKLLKAHP